MCSDEAADKLVGLGPLYGSGPPLLQNHNLLQGCRLPCVLCTGPLLCPLVHGMAGMGGMGDGGRSCGLFKGDGGAQRAPCARAGVCLMCVHTSVRATSCTQGLFDRKPLRGDALVDSPPTMVLRALLLDDAVTLRQASPTCLGCTHMGSMCQPTAIVK